MTADATLAQRLLDGDRRALARAISLVEDDRPEGWELVREVYPHTGNAAVVGFTGPPGVGQVDADRRADEGCGARRARTVGVLSIDPSSPFTQGALLGDRIRLTEHFLDQGVFIRSMANRGALGGLSEAALQAALLLDAAGREDVFVETVGVGQAEIDIIDHADTIVLVLMPGSGDSIQALKAGVMEIPDVIVDQQGRPSRSPTRWCARSAACSRSPTSTAARARCARAGGCRSSRPRPRSGAGVRELVQRLEEHRAHILAAGELAGAATRNLRSEVLSIATARMRRRLEEELSDDAASGAARRGRAAPPRPASAATALLGAEGSSLFNGACAVRGGMHAGMRAVHAPPARRTVRLRGRQRRPVTERNRD